MYRRRGKAQALRAARHGREVDRLDVNTMVIQQPVTQDFGVYRVADDHRYDVAAMIDQRQAHGAGHSYGQIRTILLG